MVREKILDLTVITHSPFLEKGTTRILGNLILCLCMFYFTYYIIYGSSRFKIFTFRLFPLTHRPNPSLTSISSVHSVEVLF